jgi:hypothetical protein
MKRLQGGCDSLQTPREGANLIVQQSRPPSVVLRTNFHGHGHAKSSVTPLLVVPYLAEVCGLHCDAQNMVLLTTETGEARAAKRGSRSEKAFDNPGRRPQKTVVLSIAIRVKEVSHRFSIFYLREQTRILGLGFTGRHNSSNSNLPKRGNGRPNACVFMPRPVSSKTRLGEINSQIYTLPRNDSRRSFLPKLFSSTACTSLNVVLTTAAISGSEEPRQHLAGS